MSSHSSNQNMETPDEAPVDQLQSPGTPADENNHPQLPAQVPGAQANVIDPAQNPGAPPNANVPAERPPVQQANNNVPGSNDNVLEACGSNVLEACGSNVLEACGSNVLGACGSNVQQPVSGSDSSESISSASGVFVEYLPEMVERNLSLVTSSSPGTGGTLGSSKTPTLSTDVEEPSSLTGTPSTDDSTDVGDAVVLTSEQMIREIVLRVPSESREKPKEGSKMDLDAEKEVPESGFGEPKAMTDKVDHSNIQRVPSIRKPVTLPAPLVDPLPRPQQRATSLPPSALVSSNTEVKSSVVVLPPVADVTRTRHESRDVKSSDADDSSNSTSGESDSPKKSAPAVAVRRRDSSDGSKADESSVSCGSPEIHKKKVLYKRLEKDSQTGSTVTTPPETPAAISSQHALSRADTLDDVETIRTDSITVLRPTSSPDRDRRAISLPANPTARDPKMEPSERRAYSEAKAQEMAMLPPPPPPQSKYTTSGMVPSEPPSEVRSEPTRRVAERVLPSLHAISEGNVSEVVPTFRGVSLMEDDSSEETDYAADRSHSNSDVDPLRERPRKEDRIADRMIREFNEAIAAAEVSSGVGTDSNAPSSTVGTSTENELAPVMAGYADWLQQPQNPQEDDDAANQSRSSSDPSRSSNLSGGQDFQMLQGWFGAGSKDQSDAGPSGVGKTPAGGMETLSVIPEKGESLSPSSGPLSPMEADPFSPKEGEDAEKSDVAMPELDPKSRLVVNLKQDSPRTPKRKREPIKSTDDYPKDPELLSPSEDSKKKYCSEFSRPVMGCKITKSSSTGSVKPDQVRSVDIASLKELAAKVAEEKREQQSKKPESGKKGSSKSPKDKTKDSDDKQERSA